MDYKKPTLLIKMFYGDIEQILADTELGNVFFDTESCIRLHIGDSLTDFVLEWDVPYSGDVTFSFILESEGKRYMKEEKSFKSLTDLTRFLEFWLKDDVHAFLRKYNILR